MKTEKSLMEIVSQLDEKFVRQFLLEAMQRDADLLERFLLKYYAAKETKKGGDSVNPELVKMAQAKALELALRLGEALDSAERYGNYEDDPLSEAEVYAEQMTEDGNPLLAVQFSIWLMKEIGKGNLDRMLESDNWSWSCWDVSNIWRGILEKAKCSEKEAAVGVMLDFQEGCSDEVPNERLIFFAEHAAPAVINRILKIMDAVIVQKRHVWRHVDERLNAPDEVRFRIEAMRNAGRGGEVEAYLTRCFPNSAFALKIRMECLEKQKNFMGAAALCREMLANEKMETAAKRDLWRTLPKLLRSAGDDEGELEALQGAFGAQAAGLDELRRLRELVPEVEWRRVLVALMARLAMNPGTPPGFMEAGELMAEENDPDLLWDYVSRVDNKKLWLAHYDCLCPRHPARYAECLLRHFEEDSEDSDWNRRFAKKSEQYAMWARNIQQVAAIEGQREKALDFARQLAAQSRSRVLKVVFTQHGLL